MSMTSMMSNITSKEKVIEVKDIKKIVITIEGDDPRGYNDLHFHPNAKKESYEATVGALLARIKNMAMGEDTKIISVSSEGPHNPVAQFIKKVIRPDPEGIITKQKLYQTYHEWCLEAGYPPLFQAAFSRSFLSHAAVYLPKMSQSRRNIDGTRVRCWAGIIDKTDY